MDSAHQTQIKSIIKSFVKIATNGCGTPQCTNALCASSSNTVALSPSSALDLAFNLIEELGEDAFQGLSSSCTNCSWLELSQLRSLSEDRNFRNFELRWMYVFENPEGIKRSFLFSNHDGISTEEQLGVNVADLIEANNILSEFRTREDFSQIISETLKNRALSLALESNHITFPLDLNEIFSRLSPQSHNAVSKAIFHLPKASKAILIKWFSNLPQDQFEEIVISMKALIGGTVYKKTSIETTKNFKIAFKSNQKRDHPIPSHKFYVELLNDIDPVNEIIKRLENKFHYVKYPYFLSPLIKNKLLQVYGRRTQILMARGSFHRPPFFPLIVNRQRLVTSATNYVYQFIENRVVSEFKKELKVKFEDEEGIDEGGVRKEFFQLIFKELFDPSFGMFSFNESSETYWINNNSEDLQEFELIGVLIGLAIYNGVILDIHFPFVVYKKIMGQRCHLEDMKQFDKVLYSSLKSVLSLKTEEDFADLNICYEVAFENFGQIIRHPLIPDGEKISVNLSNANQFVEDYIEWVFEKSIQEQFSALLKGFKHVFDQFFFEIFVAEELELLICGEPEFDFFQLEDRATYDNGYNRDHPTIKFFWEVIHSLEKEDQKRFLSFSTGSDRAPIGGLKNLQLTITRHGDDEKRLPQAHTCFNVLLLPEYRQKETMREKVRMAISNSTGFGMI